MTFVNEFNLFAEYVVVVYDGIQIVVSVFKRALFVSLCHI